MIITAEGVAVMDFECEFRAEMKRKGIRNPFDVAMELFSKRCKKNEDGSISVSMSEEKGPSRAEKDAWIIARDEYIATRLFNEFGYEAFLKRTEPRDSDYDISYLRTWDKFVPCKSADGQCSIICKYFGGKCNE